MNHTAIMLFDNFKCYDILELLCDYFSLSCLLVFWQELKKVSVFYIFKSSHCEIVLRFLSQLLKVVNKKSHFDVFIAFHSPQNVYKVMKYRTSTAALFIFFLGFISSTSVCHAAVTAVRDYCVEVNTCVSTLLLYYRTYELTSCSVGQRRTGGLVIWRSGSVMVVYRGSHYEGPTSKSQPNGREVEELFVPNVSTGNLSRTEDRKASSSLEKSGPIVRHHKQAENMTEEEAEYNSLLDGLGPRFVEWWGTGILPVDADLLPPTVPGYKTPFRLLPTGMRSRLTNAEMTNLRKVAKSLPCHFALGKIHQLKFLITFIFPFLIQILCWPL